MYDYFLLAVLLSASVGIFLGWLATYSYFHFRYGACIAHYKYFDKGLRREL